MSNHYSPNRVNVTIEPNNLTVVSGKPALQVVEVSKQGPAGISNIPNRDILTVSNDQTIFTLSKIPIRPDLAELLLNGVQQTYGKDFILNSTVLTWQGVLLADDDYLEIRYY